MGNSNQQSSEAVDRAQVPRSVIIKLLVFSLLMVIAPLGTYYLLYYILSYSSTISGISAAVSANIVLFCYILLAFMEGDDVEKKKE